MSSQRGEFGSRFGFIMAAAGSAVGLGNIWGFPTQAASNGGAAFVVVYLLLAFLLAYPVLMAELTLGRHAHGNMITALAKVSRNGTQRGLGTLVGIVGIFTASLILSFYAIVSGWMIGFGLAYPLNALGATDASTWLSEFSFNRNLLLMLVFMVLTMTVVAGGVEKGIERWSKRLMPALIVTLVALALYVLTLDGAAEGLAVYLVPDLSKIWSTDLIFNAMGAAFFSLSLGVGTMLIYGSYISDEEHLPTLGAQVALVDVGIAVLAGFLILPAMYVAADRGVMIFNEAGGLLSEDTLIFVVLPALFDSMNETGTVLALAFFGLMSIAALTSSISMLEVPVSFLVERFQWGRLQAALVATVIISAMSTAIVANFDLLFGLVITVSTRYSQPLLGLALCLYAGWVWRRDLLLKELAKNEPVIEPTLFMKWWPWYVRFVCPTIVVVILVRTIA
ncbi:sodium-dependent transporter [Luminiphilus sp.]|nr:sodium-dependent transporter [Luminiphilus sp.]MDA8590314.1 sodium-dependent transporter [Luminiphilus sp.]MDA9878011.1 sodium-dependent transporter [Luminiphilus sp.]MDB2512859.1 sodium-dependent transporter [Luminiphilus sp.]MDB3900410.1 sodium-dependent transporter [Luminiphilus sp.]